MVRMKLSSWCGSISLGVTADMSVRASLQDEWKALQAELDCWTQAGRIATFWWRDDDASDVTPALERLLGLHGRVKIPLTVAVIPKLATRDLAARLNGLHQIAVVQHGWAHLNHAAPDEKKSEFPATRPLQQRLDDLRAGEEALRDLFPERRRVLVPPWNRIAEMSGDIATLGFIALSGFKLRQQPYAAPELVQINTHIDPVDWRGGDGTSGCRAALTTTTQLLHLLRTNAAPQQALGLLTHHGRHEDDDWDFISRFLEQIGTHPAARWVGLEQALEVGLPSAV